MHCIVKFLIVLLRSSLLCYCTVLLSGVNTIHNPMHKFVGVLDNPQFNRFKAMELVEGLKNAAYDVHHEKEGYYRLVYETLLGKLELPND